MKGRFFEAVFFCGSEFVRIMAEISLPLQRGKPQSSTGLKTNSKLVSG